MLGICRGLQAAERGHGREAVPTPVHGTSLRRRCISSRRPMMRPPTRSGWASGSPLHWGLGVEELNVTSYHHQGIRELAPSLTPMAWAEDGSGGGACLPTVRFAWAVQWNPELTYQTDEDARDLFKALVKAAGERL